MKKLLLNIMITGYLILALSTLTMKLYSKTSHLSDSSNSNSYLSKNQNKSIRLLFLGDSYTIGQGIEPTGSWPSQLQNKLIKEGISINHTKVIAGNGWSSGELLNHFSKASSKNVYDLAFIQIGVNDQFRGRNKQSYSKDFERIVKLALNTVENNSGKVIVLSIPDYSFTPAGITNNPELARTEIDKFNRINMEISEKYSLHYMDITELSRTVSSSTELIAPDGLHFSEKMYQKWVEYIFPTIIEAVSAK